MSVETAIETVPPAAAAPAAFGAAAERAVAAGGADAIALQADFAAARSAVLHRKVLILAGVLIAALAAVVIAAVAL
jgi:hypothetical protein